MISAPSSGRQRYTIERQLGLRLLIVAAVALYASLLQWSYYTVEGVVGYTAINIKDIADGYLVVSLALIVSLSVLLPVKLTRPSDAAVWMLFLTFYVPAMLFTYHVGLLDEPETLTFLILVSGAFAALVMLCRLRPLTLPHIHLSHTTFSLILGVATVMVTALVILYIPDTTGGQLSGAFNLTDVYDRRMQARDVVVGRSLTGYAFATLSSSLAPLALTYGLVTGRRGFAVLGATGLLSVFLLDGTKGNLFVPALFLVIVILAKRPALPFGLVCTLGLSTIVAVSIFSFVNYDNVWLSTNVVRRVIAVRGITLGAYYELFRDQPMYMQDSSLVDLVGNRALDKAFQVGEAYGEGRESNWNGGAWAAMFADFGVVGLFLASAIVSLVLRCYDGAAQRAPFAMVVAMAGFLGHVWGDGAVPSSFLTYGVLSTLLFLTHYGVSPDRRHLAVGNLTPSISPRAVRAGSMSR